MRGLSTWRLIAILSEKRLLSGDIVTKSEKSSDQLANIFTKSITWVLISYMCNKFGIYDLYAPA